MRKELDQIKNDQNSTVLHRRCDVNIRWGKETVCFSFALRPSLHNDHCTITVHLDHFIEHFPLTF